MKETVPTSEDFELLRNYGCILEHFENGHESATYYHHPRYSSEWLKVVKKPKMKCWIVRTEEMPKEYKDDVKKMMNSKFFNQ